MTTIEHNGKIYEINAKGCLFNPKKWDKNWVDYVRVTEGISEITDDHQKVIEALRDYYKRNGTAPMINIMSTKTGYPLKRIYELFPSGPGKGACKMAGLTPIS